MSLVHGRGVNDMPRGWYLQTKENRRLYDLWALLIRRCYSKKKFDKTKNSEKEMCEEWFSLKKFVEDIKKVPGYDYWVSHPEERIKLVTDRDTFKLGWVWFEGRNLRKTRYDVIMNIEE